MKAKLEKFKELQALPVSTVILDSKGTIVGVNDAWKDFADQNGLCLPDFGIGANYLRYCGPMQQTSVGLAKDLKDLLAGRRDLVTLIYPCHSPTAQRWFFLIGLPLSIERPSGVAILHADLTKLLPIPAVARTGRSKEAQRAAKATSGILETIAGRVEESISKTLASQLNAMLTSSPSLPRKPGSGRDDLEQIFSGKGLSKRQMEVLKLLGEGKTNAEIAKALFRSPHTIKLHVSAILRQLNLKSRTQAALIASKLPRTRAPDDGK
jgi:DNA-binding NarL/FixJ family response regulator